MALRPLTVLGLILIGQCSATFAANPDRSTGSTAPDAASIERFGPGYRYPKAGWIVVHIEGQPYERGYQHGHLLAPEIVDYITTLATKRSPREPGHSWTELRTLVNALFLRRYDPEYLDEMKGIADGAAAAGAKFDGRALDLIDVAALNSDIEVEFLNAALDATATGLESRRFPRPEDTSARPAPPEHCSAFAATGPATADGKIVFGHITMFGLPFVRHYNVWLDIKPAKGHRVLMQTYAGGIMSGMDYYLNDAGLIVAETTITQTRFDINGQALASRIRKALQYADSIDGVVDTLKTSNNGMYSNEWLIADTKTNEIAMFELGTHQNRLWRSSKNDWFGGTEGFYWGCNNTKDLAVRLETLPSLAGKPANAVFHPSDRDRTWIRLFTRNKGKIGEGFGFEAFTTPPLAAFASFDAKFTTTAMAKELKTWAIFGPPLGHTWEPTEHDRALCPTVQPLVPNDWTILSAQAPPNSDRQESVRRSRIEIAQELGDPERYAAPLANDLASSAKRQAGGTTPTETPKQLAPAWRGTILPETSADIWLAAAFADYEAIVARELAIRARTAGKTLSRADQEQVDVALFAPHTHYQAAVRRWGKDVPLREIHSENASDEWYFIAAGKGTLLLAELRARLGDHKFFQLMDEFGQAHAGRKVTTEQFRDAVAALKGQPVEAGFFDQWLGHQGLPTSRFSAAWSIESFLKEPEKALIVYGTLKEKHAQREAADLLQLQIARIWSNVRAAVRADSEVTEEELQSHHLLIIGRPDTNGIAARFVGKSSPVRFGPASFAVSGDTFAHPASAVIAACANPLSARYQVVVFAGLSAQSTRSCVQRFSAGAPAEVLVLASGSRPRRIVASPTAPMNHAAR